MAHTPGPGEGLFDDGIAFDFVTGLGGSGCSACVPIGQPLEHGRD